MGEYYKDKGRYDDILYLEHYRSKERAAMSLEDRAAQFAPFMALTGYEDAIEETERLTDEKVDLDETVIEKINEKIYEISQNLSEKRHICVSYFRPDGKKAGGAYLTDIGTVKRVDEIGKMLIMDSGALIPMEQITGIEVLKSGNLHE